MNIKDSDVSPILDFYCGKTVFLTGVTGFLGECFVVKLLSTSRKCVKRGEAEKLKFEVDTNNVIVINGCHNLKETSDFVESTVDKIGVKDVYVLLRNRKNMTVKERFEKLKQSPIFEPLRKERPTFADHIIPISGTLDELELNISSEDQSILFKNIQIIVHSAADVRFDVPITTATLGNIRGTRELLTLARKMENLENFIHISTAYSHCMRDVIGEDFYEPPVDSEVMIRIVEDMSENFDVLNTIREKFISPWPNTYTFSKAINEDLVKKHAKYFKITIVRPSVVTATFHEPIKGWASNFSGANGMFAGITGGVLRCLLVNEHVPIDMVFGDFVINGALSAAHEVSTRTISYPPIYNIVSGNDYVKTFDMLAKEILPLRHKGVPLKSMWFPTFNYCHYQISYFLYNMVLHVIPAAIIDTILKLLGKKARLLKLYRQIHSFGDAINFFLSRNFKFENNNMKRVLTNMTKRDKQIFVCDFAEVHFPDYVDTYVYNGIIATLLGDPSSRQKMQKNATKLKIMHYSFTVFLALCAIFVFYMVLTHLCI